MSDLPSETEDPCAWDTDSVCSTCRKKRCPDCVDSKTCASCEVSGDSICYAFCEQLEGDLPNTLSTVNYLVWPEWYQVVRCKRRRNNVAYREEKGAFPYFPGFCKFHAKDVFHDINNHWLSLSPVLQDLVIYMIQTNECNMANFDGVINYEPYSNLSLVKDIWPVLMSPLGFMCIPSGYYFFFMWSHLTALTSATGINLIEEAKSNGVDILAPGFQQKVSHDVQEKFYAFPYTFIPLVMANDRMKSWLSLEDNSLRLMNWNIMNSKLVDMFLIGVPDQKKPWIRFFSEGWQDEWLSVMYASWGLEFFGHPELVSLWTELSMQLTATAEIVNTRIQENMNAPPIDAKEGLALGKTCARHWKQALKTANAMGSTPDQTP